MRKSNTRDDRPFPQPAHRTREETPFALEISRPTPQIRSVHPWYSNRARCGSPTPPSTPDRKSTAPAVLEETRETDWRESDPVEPDPTAGTCCQWYVQRLRITSRPQCSNRLSGTLPRAETLTFLRWRWSLELSCTVLRTTQMRVSNPTACHAPHAVFPRSTL